MDTERFNHEISELKNALEYQIDVVLKMEEERMLVFQENKIQREKIKELNQMLEKYIGFTQLTQIEKSIQTSYEVLDQAVQVEQEGNTSFCNDELSSSSMTLSQTNLSAAKSQSCISIGDLQKTENELVEEAKTLLSNTSKPKSSKLSTSRLPQKSLKFCGDNYKENKTPQQNSKPSPKDPKDLQLESMAQEVLRLNKENHQIKLQQRSLQDCIKKQEKECQDLCKALEVKNEMLERLRQDTAEMGLLINESKCKSIRVLDQELKKSQESNRLITKQLEQKNQENQQLQRELYQFRTVLEKLTDQFERLKSEGSEKSTQRNEDNSHKHKLVVLENELKIKDSSINELRNVNEKLNQETEYFRQLSLKQKERCDQQDQDLEFYRNLLVKHNIIR